ncbi:MAG: hypothetical protein HYY37_02385 [Candidatus Aenigmarchaeota archaeon]|nr:hypothetical protein [Candidatus Aenigmarchaeota archaeon]
MEFPLQKMVFLIVAVAIVFIVFAIFRVPAEAEEELKPSPAMKLLGEPAARLRSRDLGGLYDYQVELSAAVTYAGDFKEGEHAMNVVALLSFKDADTKAFVDCASLDCAAPTGVCSRTTFSISRDNPSFTGTFGTCMHSKWAPLRQNPQTPASRFTGEMKAYESLVLSDVGKFVITATAVKDSVVDRYKVGPSCVLAKSTCSVPCYVSFSVACGDPVNAAPTLKAYPLCDADKDYEKCERDLKLCNGRVHIKLNEANCDEAKAKNVEISVTGGATAYEPKETVLVSFWKSTACVGNFGAFNDLRVHCGEDNLGTFEIKAP